MNALQSIKRGLITPPAVIVDDASLTTEAIDCAGFRYLAVHVLVGATDIAITALKLQSSNASDLTGAEDITSMVFGTSLDPETGLASVLPSSTDDNKIFTFYKILDGTVGRYVDVVATIGDGTVGGYTAIMYELHGSETGLSTATARGEAGCLIG